MISLLNSFSVPGFNHITIFPDHLSPYKFYYFRNLPKVANDSLTGIPCIHLDLLQGKTKKIDEAAGYLSMTVDLGLTVQEEAAVRNYLVKKLSDSSYRGTMQLFYPDAYELLRKKGIPSPTQVELGGIGQVKKGKATIEFLEGFEDDLKISASSEETPSLSGNFGCPFHITFDKHGAAAIQHDLSFTYNTSRGTAIPTSITVRYNLTTHFFIPSIEATVKLDSYQFYTRMKNLIHEEETLHGKYNGPLSTNGGVKGSFEHGVVVNGQVYLTETDITNTLVKYRGDKTILDIDTKDYSALATAQESEVNDKIISSLIEIVSKSVIPSLFESSPLPDEIAESSYGSSDPSNPEKRVANMIHYKLRDDVVDSDSLHRGINFKKSSLLELDLAASSTLVALIPDKYADKVIRMVNVDNSEFVYKYLQIGCSLDLALKRINLLELRVIYDEKDARFSTKRYEGYFPFHTGSETYEFEFPLAKDAKGEFLTKYRYSFRFYYAGKGSVGNEETWVESDAPNITLSPEIMGFISVDCQLGDVDWNLVKDIKVDFNYPEVQGETDTSGFAHFTSAADPVQNWTCFKYGKSSNEYTYKIHYIDIDGGEYETPEMRSAADHLLINDLYEGKPLKAAFHVEFSSDFVRSVRVEVKYEDNLPDTYTFNEPGDWVWQKRVRAGADETFRYRYYIVYQSGKTEYRDKEWSAPCGRDTDIDPLELMDITVIPIKFQVIGTVLFADPKWILANVFVKYIDEDKDTYIELDPIPLTPDKQMDSVSFNIPAGERKPFLCAVELFSSNPEDYVSFEQECPRASLTIIPPKQTPSE